MNSKERRKDRRKWKYHVRYHEYGVSERYNEMWDWLCQTYGNKHGQCWREKYGHIGDYWQFDNEEAMMMFVLRFGAGDYKYE
jgi:hypothetical protein